MQKMNHDLSVLRRRLLEMGDLAERMVGSATKALAEPHNQELFDRVRSDEQQLDQMQVDIDHEAVRLLTIYSPVAHDLRFVLSVTRINSELERIGDHCMNMCEAIGLMTSKVSGTPLPEINKMTRLVGTMVHDALDAFSRNDSHKARATMNTDDLVDTLNDQIIHELLSDEVVREAISMPKDITGALSQLLLARSLERIADQACNICEEIVYMVKGADIRHEHEPAAHPSE